MGLTLKGLIIRKYNPEQNHLTAIFFLIAINSMQGWTATTRHGVTRKRNTKKLKHRKSVQKEPTVQICLLIIDLKPFRSCVKGKHSIGSEFQGLAVRGKKLLT